MYRTPNFMVGLVKFTLYNCNWFWWRHTWPVYVRVYVYIYIYQILRIQTYCNTIVYTHTYSYIIYIYIYLGTGKLSVPHGNTCSVFCHVLRFFPSQYPWITCMLHTSWCILSIQCRFIDIQLNFIGSLNPLTSQDLWEGPLISHISPIFGIHVQPSSQKVGENRGNTLQRLKLEAFESTGQQDWLKNQPMMVLTASHVYASQSFT